MQVSPGDKVCSLASEDSKDFEEEGSEDEEGEGTCRDGRASKLPPGAVQVLPPSLSDQFQLLSPSSSRQDAAHFHPSPQTTGELYSAVNKSVRSNSEGGEGKESSPCPQRSRADSLPGAVSSEKAAGNTLFMHDIVPPWKQMVRRACVMGVCGLNVDIVIEICDSTMYIELVHAAV